MTNKIKINLNDFADIKRFVSVVTEFMSDVDVITDRTRIDAKSMLGLLSLDLSQDIYVLIISDSVEECRNFDAAMTEFV